MNSMFLFHSSSHLYLFLFLPCFSRIVVLKMFGMRSSCEIQLYLRAGSLFNCCNKYGLVLCFNSRARRTLTQEKAVSLWLTTLWSSQGKPTVNMQVRGLEGEKAHLPSPILTADNWFPVQINSSETKTNRVLPAFWEGQLAPRCLENSTGT